MTAPAKWRPSSLPSLALCPGWQSAPGTTDAAERGTRIHAAIADVVSGRAPVPTQANDEADAVRYALEVMAVVRDRHPDHTLRAEVAVDAGVPGVHGTADLCGVDGWGETVVLDWKSGWGDHGDAASSLQLVAYALGARAELGHRGGAVLYLVDLDKRQVSACRWSSAELDSARRRIQQVIAAAETHTDADLRPSKDACRYCSRSATCPAALGAALTLEAPPMPDVSVITPEDVGRVLDELERRVAQATVVLGGLKTRAREMMEAGQPVPGWRLKTGTSRRVWRASAAEVQAAVPEVDLLDIVTPAAAERRITTALGGSKANAREAWALLSRLIDKVPTAPSVVRADEKDEA